MPSLSDLTPHDPLTGRFVQLEPMIHDHVAGLMHAARDERIWAHTAYDEPFAYFDAAFAARGAGEQVPFAVRRLADGALVGMSRLFEIDGTHKRCEIGYTWYVPDAWGTEVNPEAKLLLMTHCFDTWGARRVQFKTDNENLRSQAAIAKLGALREGVLRSHMVRRDGTQRDSVIFSITREEWPGVKSGLEGRLTSRS